MTLILAAFGEHNPVITLSDILVSRPFTGAHLSTHVPTQAEALDFVKGDWSPAGVSQKAVIVGRSIFLWAGQLVVAKLIITRAASASSGGKTLLDFPRFIDSLELSSEELSEVSIIYIYNGPNRLQEWHLNAAQVGEPPGFQVHAGSGAWHFLEDTVVAETKDPEGKAGKGVFSLLSRAMTTLISEAVNGTNYNYLYGGWLELAWLDEAGEFTKIPYAIKFWLRDGNIINTELPLYFSWYEDQTLAAARFEIKKGGPEFNIHYVQDFLGRGRSPEGAPSIVWNPNIVCHVLLTKGSPSVETYIRANMPDVFSVEVLGDQARVNICPGFLGDMLSGKLKEGFSFHVGRQSEVGLEHPDVPAR